MNVTIVRETARCFHLAQKKQMITNAFVSLRPKDEVLNDATVSDQRIKEERKLSSLDGKCFAIKDNICTKDTRTTCASRMLAEFRPEYDATAVTKLKESGAIILGKTNMDEFGMGSQSIFSHFGPVKNPYSSESVSYTAGGSSGGSAAAVASTICFGALGSDTGGSVRLPAAYCGIVGFKPSYGLISRRGLIAYANSLDTVGIFARDVKSTSTIYDLIKGHDGADPTSLKLSIRNLIEAKSKDYQISRKSSGRGWKIGVPIEYNISDLSESLRYAWFRILALLKDIGHEIVPVQLPSTRQALSSYYIIAPAEAASNLAKYDGVRFGFQRDSSKANVANSTFSALRDFIRTREEGLGREVQRRILLGNYSLSSESIENYFLQAQKIRRMVKEDFDNIFIFPNLLNSCTNNEQSKTRNHGVDILITPTCVSVAPVLADGHSMESSSIDDYINDIFTVPASMAGLPALSLPIHSEGSLPVGIQIIAQYGDDNSVLELANLVENL